MNVNSIELSSVYIRRKLESDIITSILTDPGSRSLVLGAPGVGKTSMLWSIAMRLEAAGRTPIFVRASSLIGHSSLEPAISLGTLRQALVSLENPVLLVDTLDIISSQIADSGLLPGIDESLEESGAALVATMRPEALHAVQAWWTAARVRTLGDFEYTEGFGESELTDAVGSYAALYADKERDRHRLIHDVLNAATRSLPMRAICIRPLTLRMLFETYAPLTIPEEINTTHLYQKFWRTKITSDIRVGHRGDPRDEKDLSAPAMEIARQMLASGVPELETDEIGGADVNSIKQLLRRGVLQETGGVVSFFHQTFFEFAAAQWILRRQILADLKQYLDDHPHNLFLEAVFEQAILLAYSSRSTAQAADGVITALLNSPSRRQVELGISAGVQARHLGLDVLKQLVQTLHVVDIELVAHAAALLPEPSRLNDIDTMLLSACLFRPDRAWRRAVFALERIVDATPTGDMAKLVDLLEIERFLNGLPAAEVLEIRELRSAVFRIDFCTNVPLIATLVNRCETIGQLRKLALAAEKYFEYRTSKDYGLLIVARASQIKVGRFETEFLRALVNLSARFADGKDEATPSSEELMLPTRRQSEATDLEFAWRLSTTVNSILDRPPNSSWSRFLNEAEQQDLFWLAAGSTPSISRSQHGTAYLLTLIDAAFQCREFDHQRYGLLISIVSHAIAYKGTDAVVVKTVSEHFISTWCTVVPSKGAKASLALLPWLDPKLLMHALPAAVQADIGEARRAFTVGISNGLLSARFIAANISHLGTDASISFVANSGDIAALLKIARNPSVESSDLKAIHGTLAQVLRRVGFGGDLAKRSRGLELWRELIVRDIVEPPTAHELQSLLHTKQAVIVIRGSELAQVAIEAVDREERLQIYDSLIEQVERFDGTDQVQLIRRAAVRFGVRLGPSLNVRELASLATGMPLDPAAVSLCSGVVIPRHRGGDNATSAEASELLDALGTRLHELQLSYANARHIAMKWSVGFASATFVLLNSDVRELIRQMPFWDDEFSSSLLVALRTEQIRECADELHALANDESTPQRRRAASNLALNKLRRTGAGRVSGWPGANSER